MTDTSNPLSDKRIGVFGKGGSGKSTVTVLLARALVARGYDVCVLDADSTNVGLHRALGLDEPPVPLLDYFGGMVFSGGAVTCPVDDPTLLPDAVIPLDALPGRPTIVRVDQGEFALVAVAEGDRALRAPEGEAVEEGVRVFVQEGKPPGGPRSSEA